ncbi:Arabidopsis protein of unknown function (DUF241 [Striga hermonthica]|uniref:Uncharacterized protein n=1 Tax=Striga hermonthica TaxID=68872 RepID=A0A9N7R2T8_STRHE|nr:Arabidopsis protein of unknown function (DUF241 [Striga hermonthica]
MVASFRRSLSFPNPPSPSARPRKALHVRSASLPCSSHPIISHLCDDIAALRSCSAAPLTSASLCGSLRRLGSLHDSLDDLLHLPQTRDSLRAPQIERLLDHFLRLVDLYGTFQALALRLKDDLSAAQISVCRKDGREFASRLKNLSRIAKEIGSLSPNYHAPIGKLSPYDDEADLVEVIESVLGVTCVVSAALFSGLSGSSAFKRPSGLVFGAKAKNGRVEGGIREFEEMSLEKSRKLRGEEEVKMASKTMQEMEDRIMEIEGCGEKVFRSLINTRVSLLNVVTQ